MKGKISFKTIVILVILVLVGVLGVLGMNTMKTYLGSAAAGSEPKAVLAAPSDDGKSATVTWTTDKSVQAIVEYGTTPASLLLRSLETDATMSHRVVLTPLKSGVNYYFRIKVGEEIFDNNGIPYSFKTGEPMVAEVTPTIVEPTKAIAGAPACSQTVDYNGDGVVNSLDYVQCVKNGGENKTATPTTEVVNNGGCVAGVDYDANGTINSLDMIKCLQKK